MKGNTMEVEKGSDDIQFLLQGQLDNCSRQRLRALEISLNRHSHSESRITSKDMQLALQENDIHLSERTIWELCDYYSDNRGVNYQAVHQCLQEAQSRTGRDSVIAMNKKPTRKQRPKEEQMEDLIQRLRKVLLGENCAPIDIEKVEEVLAEKDKEQTSLLPKEEVLFWINDLDLPIYGALLDALVSSLLNTKDSHLVRWRQVLNVIGMIQNNADTSNVMAILVPVEKGKIQNSRHIRMVSGSKPRPTNDLHPGSKIHATNQVRQGKAHPDFDLSTRIVNQSNKQDVHGLECVQPEPPKSTISVAPQNSPQMTGTTIGAGRGRDVKNGGLIPKPNTLSSERASPIDALVNPDSAENVSDDKKEDPESTEISFGLQQVALAVAGSLPNTEAAQQSA